MKACYYLTVASLVILSSCANNANKTNDNNNSMANNPFMNASTLPFQTADFSKIKDSDFKPAIEEGIKQQLAEIKKIAENPDAPTFENTFVEWKNQARCYTG